MVTSPDAIGDKKSDGVNFVYRTICNEESAQKISYIMMIVATSLKITCK